MGIQYKYRKILTVFTIVGFALLWAICQSTLLNHFASDGSIDASRVVSSGLVYVLLLNTLLWLPLLCRNHLPQVLLTCLTLLCCLSLVHFASPYIIPTLAYPQYRSFASQALHHVLPPKTRMFEGKYDGVDVYVDTNEDGLRTRYTRQQFASMGVRIIVMGDSFAFGLGVRQSQVWPQVLENKLRSRFGRGDIGVLNAGVISYSPILEARQFDGILRHYKPDLVILLLDPTDIGDDYTYAVDLDANRGVTTLRPPGSLSPGIWTMTQGVRAYMGSALSFPYDVICRHLMPQFMPKKPYNYYDFRLKIGGTVETNRFFIYRYSRDNTRAFYDFTYSNIVNIAESAHDLGATFILAPSPRFHHWNTNECPANWESKSYRLDEPFQFEYLHYFRERARSGHIEMIDLLGAFQSTTNFPLVFRNDPHWNEAGHDFVASVMEKYIVKHHAGYFEKTERSKK